MSPQTCARWTYLRRACDHSASCSAYVEALQLILATWPFLAIYLAKLLRTLASMTSCPTFQIEISQAWVEATETDLVLATDLMTFVPLKF